MCPIFPKLISLFLRSPKLKVKRYMLPILLTNSRRVPADSLTALLLAIIIIFKTYLLAFDMFSYIPPMLELDIVCLKCDDFYLNLLNLLVEIHAV